MDTTTVFINYRKAESSGWARLLYDRLASELGAENVFLDQVSLKPGMLWLQDIRARSAGCAVFIALIGPEWASTMSRRAESGEEDLVRTELEAALRRDSRVKEVIPATVEGALIPREEDLPYLGSVHPLLKRQQLDLRPTHWDADVQVLIERLQRVEATAEESEEPAPAPPEPAASAAEPAEAPLPGATPVAPPPDRNHYDELVRLMLEEGSVVVPFLGPGANSCDRTEPWEHSDSGYLPNSAELAAYLALKLGPASIPADLANVSQSVSVAKGPGDLYMALRRALPSGPPPGSVHRFLAGFPAAALALGLSERYQLIVTTNYDDALERAFEEAEEPYDLAVYIARGRDKGRFVHVPHDGEPRAITDANGYADFPIDAFGRVERTVIVKIHGTVDSPRGSYPWRDNYVITEDDYIDYMSVGDIESIVPQQLLGKLRDYSHFLFLGHEMRDWSLRVFLIRVFGERPQPNTSWAIQREPNRLDERFWQRIGVDLAAISLEQYVGALGDHLPRVASSENPA
ncbi:MAG TPA: SIR2 family protein [Solirubrobacterales bacterium]|nr:SIR2 family protein [Solirubrobacterales bacterium]